MKYFCVKELKLTVTDGTDLDSCEGKNRPKIEDFSSVKRLLKATHKEENKIKLLVTIFIRDTGCSRNLSHKHWRESSGVYPVEQSATITIYMHVFQSAKG